MPTNSTTTLGAASGDAAATTLQSLLLLFLTQMKNTNCTMTRHQDALQEERERHFQELNRLAQRNRDMSLELYKQELQIQSLLKEEKEHQQRMEKIHLDLENKEATITSLTSQLQKCIPHEPMATYDNNSSLQMQKEYYGIMTDFQNDMNESSCCEKMFNLRRLSAILNEHTIDKAIFAATKENRVRDMEVLLSYGLVQPDKLDGNGKTLLWWAAYSGNAAATKMLLKYGANVCGISPGADGDMALHIASWNGHLPVVKLLVKHGADIDTKSISGNNALILAAKRGQLDVVQYLVEKGADLQIRDYNGNSVYYLAQTHVQKWLEGNEDWRC